VLRSWKARNALGRVTGALGLNQLGYHVQRALARPMIRAVNYHSVAARDEKAFERHLEHYAARYDDVSLEELAAFLRGEWQPRRPGIIISSDDGLRTDHDVMAPALERFGFTGWFFVPSDLIVLPAGEQVGAATAARVTPLEVSGEGRVFMSPAEVRDLAQRHVIGCHTASHVRLSSALDPQRLHAEIVESRRKLEAHTGTAIDVFCWVGGEDGSYSRSAATVIRDAGYGFSFMTASAPIRPWTNPLQLHRTNMEVHYSVALVGLFLSGLMDMRYAARRRRRNALTAVGRPVQVPGR
jgi:peptidoglycan/xylan/chitin deacetylase (PgdA/CDA1 family)